MSEPRSASPISHAGTLLRVEVLKCLNPLPLSAGGRDPGMLADSCDIGGQATATIRFPLGAFYSELRAKRAPRQELVAHVAPGNRQVYTRNIIYVNNNKNDYYGSVSTVGF